MADRRTEKEKNRTGISRVINEGDLILDVEITIIFVEI
jgi:hypothetical protein